MMRAFLAALLFLALNIPTTTFADNSLQILESVSATGIQVQKGLTNYHVRVETSRIEEMMSHLTKGIPDDVPPPSAPVIYKFWQSNGKGLVYSDSNGLTPYIDKIVKQASGYLAIELNRMLLPDNRAEQRGKLAEAAKVKTNEVALGSKTINQIEIIFDKPTDLDEAFYVTGMRLPQKKVAALAFDIDSTMNTISEMKVTTANGLQLTTEIRYTELAGGFIPVRFQVTSPDGRIDDVFEVSFADIEGYTLPSKMVRTIRRPNLKEDLEIVFKDYRINQPISPDVKKRLEEL